MRHPMPYPLRAARLTIDVRPFGLWVLPHWHRRELSEERRKEGEALWWIRWLWFQLSYSRWV